MIRLLNLVTKTIDNAPDDLEIGELPSHYKVLKPNGQYDSQKRAIYTGDILQRGLQVVFHNDFDEVVTIIDEDYKLSDPSSWTIIGDKWRGIRAFREGIKIIT